MKLSESQFIWQSIWIFSLCSPCWLLLDDLNEAFWISIYLANYLSLFTFFTLFTCSWWYEWSFLKLNSFNQVFEFVHFVHLVHLFSMIWKRLSEYQFIWLGIWVCSLCSLVLEYLKEAAWISIHLIRYLSLFTLFTLFTCSWEFKCSCLNLNSFYKVFFFVHFVHLVHLFSRIWKRLPESQFIWLGIWVWSLCSHCSLVLKDLNEAFWI